MLTKQVNGKQVAFEPQDEAKKRAEWTEETRPRTPQEVDGLKNQEANKHAGFNPAMQFLLDEINILREQAGLPIRTQQDVKTSIKAGL